MVKPVNYTTRDPLFPCSLRVAMRGAAGSDCVRQPIRCSDHRFNSEIACSAAFLPESPGAGQFSSLDGMQDLLFMRHSELRTASIRVMATRIPREVSAADFLSVFLDVSRESLIRSRVFRSPVGSIPDFLSSHATIDQRKLIRRNALKDGDRLLVVETAAAENEYLRISETFLIALASFKLENPEQIYSAEAMQTVSLPLLGVQFAIPASWRAQPADLADCRTRSRFIDCIANDSDAEIAVRVLPADAIESSASPPSHLTTANSSGYGEGLYMPMPDELRNQCFDTLMALVAESRVNSRTVEHRVAVLSQSASSVLVSLTGPARRGGGMRWAINKRAFELVVESIRLQSEHH